jgi:hypothetical protein
LIFNIDNTYMLCSATATITANPSIKLKENEIAIKLNDTLRQSRTASYFVQNKWFPPHSDW